MKQLRSVLATLVLALAVAAPAAARGGGGTVTTFGVGPLSFDLSTSNDVLSWAGNPDRIVYWDQNGSPTRVSYGNAAFAIAQYNYAAHGYISYGFYWDGSEWLLGEFDTTLERFHDERGTRVGMSYGEARRRENRPLAGGCLDSGLWRFHYGADGELYSMVVGVNRGQRVHALHAYGPNPLPC
jgi:hypothetical protein